MFVVTVYFVCAFLAVMKTVNLVCISLILSGLIGVILAAGQHAEILEDNDFAEFEDVDDGM
jgi:hypothetical protein